MLAGAVGCSITPRVARTAASILARTFRARRVRFTSGKSMVAPVVRMLDLAVGPSASSNPAHARATLEKIAPAVEFTHCQRETPRAASSTAGIIRRHSHKRLGQTIMYSKSRKYNRRHSTAYIMRFAASKHSSVKYHFVPPVDLP